VEWDILNRIQATVAGLCNMLSSQHRKVRCKKCYTKISRCVWKKL